MSPEALAAFAILLDAWALHVAESDEYDIEAIMDANGVQTTVRRSIAGLENGRRARARRKLREM